MNLLKNVELFGIFNYFVILHETSSINASMREFLSAFVDPMFKVAFYSALGLFISSVVFLLILSVTIVENDKLKNDNEKLILEMKINVADYSL